MRLLGSSLAGSVGGKNKALFKSRRTSQGVCQEFVHLANLRRDAQIDCAVTNFHDQSSFDVRIDLSMRN